jgi:hypothetical protein
MYEGRSLWDFDMYDIEQLERLLKIDKELREEYGLQLDEDMVAEVKAELTRKWEKSGVQTSIDSHFV